MVSGRRAPLAIRCRLLATPQLGEGIEIDFVSGFTGGDAYYVDRLLSEYANGAITTYVYLKLGYYDPYLWQLRARARFEGKLPFAIEREMCEFDVQDYLRSLYGPAPGAVAKTAERGGQPGDKRGQKGTKGDSGSKQGRKKESRVAIPQDTFLRLVPQSVPR